MLSRENQRIKKECEHAVDSYMDRLEASNKESDQAKNQLHELTKQLDSERRASQRIIDRLQADIAQKDAEFAAYKLKA
jgi:prefoldin subunit 5